ncbi:hypothetical protein [Cytobacillus sp. IB215665]|uniref:hypothetical protein n=1 Tax=Cytobacillus sp. IB215665 TaxID=3097357 RepID=UPI002A0CB88F|nr:hypothetical protein [Cytobacillus sp. IB215665]MDX8367874.1 hypothetical protein [Cytobacillus sp. IB215665]
MSKIDEIKEKKRQQRTITPSMVLSKSVEGNQEENNVEIKEETKIERKRVSFDLRTDLHKKVKMKALLEERNIYLIIEDALEKYLTDNNNNQ